MQYTFLAFAVILLGVSQICNSKSVDPCAPVCGSGTYNVPHPQDCSLYYTCSGGKAVLEECPNGLFYSPTFGVCDHPINAGCTANPNYVCPGSVSTTSIPQTTAESTTMAVTTPVETTADAVGSTTDLNLPTSDAFSTTEDVTSNADTTTEARTTGVPTTDAQTTEAQTTEERTTAAHTTAAQTTQAQTTEAETTEARTTDAQTTDAQTTDAQTTDAQTTDAQTTDAQATEAQTTVAQTTEAQTTQAQTTDAQTTTEAAQPTTTPEVEECIPPCPSSSAIYPDPRDCSSYFQCTVSVPIHRTCSGELEFNPEIGVCDYPANFECTSGPDAPCVAVIQPPKHKWRR